MELSNEKAIYSVLGDILVVKPSFIFPGPAITNITVESFESADRLKGSDNYVLGVGICFYVAAAAAMSNVINVSVMESSERISTSHLMVTTGVFSILTSLACSLLIPNRLVTAPLSIPPASAASLLVSAMMTFLAFWLITLAVTVTKTPTLISMLRSTEIVLSLVTESVWWGEPPHNLSILGSLLVMCD